MARPSKLTPEVQERICQVLRDGETLDVAARAGGITYQTFLNWKALGKAAGEGLYFDFYLAVEDAEPAFRTEQTAIVAGAARGGQTITETRVVTKRRMMGGESDEELDDFLKEMGMRAREGQRLTEAEARTMLIPVEETTTVITKTTLPNWRAALEMLQRRAPGAWNKTTTLKLDNNDLGEKLAAMGIAFDEWIRYVTEQFLELRQQYALADSGGGAGESAGTGGTGAD